MFRPLTLLSHTCILSPGPVVLYSLDPWFIVCGVGDAVSFEKLLSETCTQWVTKCSAATECIGSIVMSARIVRENLWPRKQSCKVFEIHNF